MRSKYIPLIGLLLGTMCLPALGADRDFESVVGAIEGHLGVRRTHIPMMGLAKFFVKASSPSGIHQLELATFENLDYSPENLQGFRTTVGRALGESWQPMVQVQAPWRREYTGIFVKGQKGKFHLMIATIEAREATVVEIQLSPAQLFDWLRAPRTMGHRAGGSDRDDCCAEE